MDATNLSLFLSLALSIYLSIYLYLSLYLSISLFPYDIISVGGDWESAALWNDVTSAILQSHSTNKLQDRIAWIIGTFCSMVYRLRLECVKEDNYTEWDGLYSFSVVFCVSWSVYPASCVL